MSSLYQVHITFFFLIEKGTVKLTLGDLGDNIGRKAMELSLRPESLGLGLGFKETYSNGWRSDMY